MGHQSRHTWSQNSGNPAGFTETDVDLGSDPNRILLVCIRHGSSVQNITHGTPTVDDGSGPVAMTQVESIVDANAASNNRRMSLWVMVDPPAGLVDIATTFSNQVAQFSACAVVAAGHSGTGASLALSDQNSSPISMSLDTTDPDGIAYLFALLRDTGDDPFTPGTITEVEDSNDHGTVTNHHYTTGWVDISGDPQVLSTTPASGTEWAGIAIELLSVAPSGDDHTATLTDEAAIADDLTSLLTTGREITDDAAASDEMTQLMTAARSLTDPAEIADSLTKVSVAARSLDDSADIADELSYDHTISGGGSAFNREITDTAPIDDAGGEWVMPNTITPDTAAITDEITVVQHHARTITDQADIEDHGFGGLNEAAGGQGDPADITDELTYVHTPGVGPQAHERAITDSAGITDEIGFAHEAGGVSTHNRMINDSAAISDTLTYEHTVGELPPVSEPAGTDSTAHREPPDETSHREGSQ